MPHTLLAFALAVRLSSRMSLPRFQGRCPSFRRKPEPTSPPPQPPRRFGRQPKPFPTVTQIKRITVQDQAPPTATPSKVRAATKPIPKITQIKRITVQDQAPPTSHHTTTPPVFPAKPGTRAPSAPSVYPRVAVDATPPNRLSGESRNLRHPPTATPSKVRAATKPVPKITQIKRITVQDQAPPTSHHTTTPPVFPPKAGTRAPSPPSVYPRVAVDATPPTRLAGESRNLRHLPNRNPLEGPDGNQTSPKNHPNQTNHSSRPSAPHQSPHHHPHPSFQLKAGTHAPSPPSVYPRVAVDATPPNRLSGESRNLRHPPPQPPRRSGRQPNQSQKSLKSNESQFKTKRPPPVTTPPPPPVFPLKAGTHAPSPPSVYPRVAVDATPPTRLSGESRNLRHPPTAIHSKVRTATKPVPKITQIKRITVQDQAPPTSHHTTTPTRLSSRKPEPTPPTHLPYTHESP